MSKGIMDTNVCFKVPRMSRSVSEYQDNRKISKVLQKVLQPHLNLHPTPIKRKTINVSCNFAFPSSPEIQSFQFSHQVREAQQVKLMKGRRRKKRSVIDMKQRDYWKCILRALINEILRLMNS